MEPYKLTTRSQEALSVAVRSAAGAGNPQVETAHLLLALLAQADGTARPLLDAVGADRLQLTAAAERLVKALPAASGSTVAAPELARPTITAMNKAADEARRLDDEYVSTEHILVGLASGSDRTA